MARATATTQLSIVDTIIQAYSAAFTANPIYAIVILVIGFVIGWFLHYQAFGY